MSPSESPSDSPVDSPGEPVSAAGGQMPLEPSPSLYERVGGADAVHGAISEFYSRVFNDPELAPFFAYADRDKLARMQTEFFTVALGGPGTYAGMTLADAHRGRSIQPHHVADFTEHLLETMRRRGMPADAIDEVVSRITILAQEVLGAEGESG